MLGTITRELTGWVRENVTGSGISAQDYVGRDPDARRVDRELGRIEDGLREVDGRLDRIREETSLEPPSLSRVSPRQLLVAGASTGAALGAAAGLTDGLVTTALDEGQVTITETRHPIYRPEFKGYHELPLREDVQKFPVYDGQGNIIDYRTEVKGWYQGYEPDIEQVQVGEYTTREARVEHTRSGSPLSEGIKGMAMGAALGVGVAGALEITRRLTGKGAYDGSPPRDTQGDRKVVAVTGAAGTAVGAGVGLLSGMIEASHAGVRTFETESPVMESVEIGRIPKEHYISALSTGNGRPQATEPVIRDVPKMRLGLTGRKPVVEVTEQTVEVEPRFGVLGAVVGGAVVGGVAGVATGVLLNVLRKAI